jgi:TonB-linked SusC/RagA family outer membrane protein
MNILLQGNAVPERTQQRPKLLYPTRKMWRVMKLTAMMMMVTALHVSAAGFSQRVTIPDRPMTMKEVFRSIKEQTGLDFFYNETLFDASATIQVAAKDKLFTDVLDKCLQGKGLTYMVKNNAIIIKKSTEAYTAAVLQSLFGSPAKEVQGIVMDSTGAPLPDVSVTVKGMGKTVTTDQRGRFSIQAAAGDTLVFSSIGFVTQYHKITDPSKSTGILLKASVSQLDEVQIQAYGQTSRRYTTSNIGRVKADEIARQPVMDPIMALQGRVPGLLITPQTGYEGGPVKVEIRGRTSVNTNQAAEPLYIIDGVPLTILDVRGAVNVGNNIQRMSPGFDQTGMSSAGGQNPLFSLNPGDIESIDVLKDADATAIYGSRGANGVILVTTKKGKAGKSRADINLSQGASIVTGRWKMLNTEQYRAMRKEAFANDGITPTSANAPELFLADSTRYTDWQNVLWGKAGSWTNAQVGLSGGTQQTTFRIGAAFNSTRDITVFSGKNTRASLSVSLVNRSLNQRFVTSFSANYSSAVVNQVSLSGLADEAPNAPDIFDSTGRLNFAGWKTAGLSYPYASLAQPYSSKTQFLTSNLSLSYSIAKGLIARASLGYNNSVSAQTSFVPIAAQDPYTSIKPTGRATFGNTNVNNWIVEPQLEYTGLLSKGRISVLVGGTIQNNTTDGLRTLGTGYTNDALLYSISNAPTVTAEDNYGQYKYAGVFARINYNWQNKYILNLNGRRDGSSRFGPGNRFGNFGSVGAAWIVSEEKWIAAHLPAAVSFIKLRGSYGITGSDQVGDYKYLSQWGNLGTNRLTPYNDVAPLVPQLQPNVDFHWEVNRKLEGALDLAFLQDRISLELAYYRNRCNNQLISYPLGIFTGFSSVVANSPADVQNSGIELQINARLIQHKRFSWQMDFNWSKNSNKLLAYPYLELSPYYGSYKIGESIGNRYVYQYNGIDPLTGQNTFIDKNGDGKISGPGNIPAGSGIDDRIATINMNPAYSGGWGNQFTYGSWQLSLFCTYRKQVGSNALNFVSGTNNMSKLQYDNRWQYAGQTNATFARLTTAPILSDYAFTSSSLAWTDASYIRLQNVELRWMMPVQTARKIGMGSLGFSMSAQNIFVLTKFKGLDPESTSFGSMPPKRTLTLGINCSL